MTIILAIDSATGPCSAALWKDGRVIDYLENAKPGAQSATLMPMIEAMLKQNSLDYRDISLIAATIGPGSFTGIRIGLALARGIAFAAGIRGVGFTTLEVMAFAATPSPTLPRERGRVGEGVLAMLNAGKGEYYYQLFGTARGQPCLGTREQALAVASNAAITEQLPSARALAELAAMNAPTAQSLTPFYIRPPDAKLPVQKP